MSLSHAPVLEVNSFHKSYDGFSAVKDVNFSLNAGEILGVIGPNGAGKTTTMRAISTLIPPTSGELRVAGFDVETQPVNVKRRLAYVPDDPGVFPHLTVAEHLAFTAAAFSVDDADRKAEHLLESFELIQKANIAAKDLSRGMRQKLAICCAYLYDPLALLFDEPLTGLDPMGIRILKQSIQDRASDGAAVMVSSHLLPMVEDICTHILLIHQGQQRFFGTVNELTSQFQSNTEAASLEQIFFLATEDSASSPAILPPSTELTSVC